MAEEAWLKRYGAEEDDSTLSIAETQLLPPAASTDLPSFFFEYAPAQAMSSRERRPLVVYYHNDVARGCQEQAELMAGTGFQDVAEQAIFSAVDVRNSPQVAQQNAVFRVPTWIYYDSNGNEVARRVGVQQAENVASDLAQLR